MQTGTSIDDAVRRTLGPIPERLRQQVMQLIAEGRLASHLEHRYPARHTIQTDAALHAYATALKRSHLRTAPPLHKVIWQNKMDVLQQVLGLHTSISRVQGQKLKAKAEIRIASLFKSLAPEFLEMVVVHELAHLRERDHGKAFYQLCEHMLPGYAQIEFDLRLWLLQRQLESVIAPHAAAIDGLNPSA